MKALAIDLAGGASFDAGSIEIVHAVEKLNSTKSKRSAKHSSRARTLLASRQQ
jgi:hypothetical protein